MAGLVCYYDTRNYVYLHVSHDEAQGRVVALLRSDAGEVGRPKHEPLAVPGEGAVRLRMVLDHDRLVCWAATLDGPWQALGQVFDAGLLSDEYDKLGFTGTFLAMAAQDLAGTGFVADFTNFVYREDDTVGPTDSQR
jgi:xylan 1,4-beta-xylosidase